MKQYDKLYRDDIEELLKQKFLGHPVDRFWNSNLRDVLKETLPEEYRDGFTVYVKDGNSLYANVRYEGINLFVVGIKRARTLEASPHSCAYSNFSSQCAKFTYKDIVVYFDNDELSLKDLIEKAIEQRKAQADAKNEKLKKAKQAYDFIKGVLQTSSYLEISDFLSFMRNNLGTIEDM